MAPLLSQWEPTWVKVVNPPPGPDPFPGVRKLLRIWHDDTQAGYIARGEAGGRQWVRDYLPKFRQVANWGEVVFETANEPDCNSNEGLANLRLYSLGAMKEAEANGLRLCILNLPEGNPGDNGLGERGRSDAECRAVERWKLEQLAEAVDYAARKGHYVGLHAYWLPSENIGPLDRWHGLGRVQWNVEQWIAMGVDTSRLRVFINETGVDRLISKKEREKRGWRSQAGGLDAYARQVVELERALRQLPWVEAAMLFTVGFEEPWGDYDHRQDDLRVILARLKEVPMTVIYGPDATVKYWHSSREGQKIAHIVLHDTEGSAEAALSWWAAPSNPYKSSAHVLVRKNGDVLHVVPEVYAAHHAGYATIPGVTVNPNLVSLGLEMECSAAPNPPGYTEAQLQAAIGVVRDWMTRYGIPKERVWLHREIDAKKSDPRDFDKAAFIKRLEPSELEGWLDQVPATIKAVAEMGLIPLGVEKPREAGGYWGLGWDMLGQKYVAVGVQITSAGIEIAEMRDVAGHTVKITRSPHSIPR